MSEKFSSRTINHKQPNIRYTYKLFIQLPFLDHQRLTSHRELRLAHLLLSAIATGYIWQDGDQGVPKVRRPYRQLTFYYSFGGIMFGCANE